jgi:tetratricopeptide (TPR) repeat protein
VVGIVAGVVALAVAVRLLDRGDGSPPPEPSVVLPDPDTSGMTEPVARAIREARAAALADPDSATAVGRLGQVYHAHWLYDAAADCYEIARERAPEEFRWVYLLAGVEELRGADGERVDRLFREATRLAPDYPALHVRHGDALMRLGRWSEARGRYAAAVERDPEMVLAHRGLGQAATLLGDGPAAVEHLEQAAALAPDDRITQIALARAYGLVGLDDRAAEATGKARSLSTQARLPDQIFFEVERLAVDPETLRGRVTRALRAGDYDTALAALALLEESEGSGARDQLALASKLASKQRANRLAFGGDFDAALLEFERASRLAPADPEIEHNWGTVLLRLGELAEAERHFERAIELDPQSADSLYNLGVVLEGLGRAEEAIERFAAAAAINPRHVAAQRLAELGAADD